MFRNCLLFLLLTTSFCNTKTPPTNRPGETWVYVYPDDVPEVEKLKGKPFGIDKLYIPRKPFLVDNYLVISDKFMKPPLHVIDLKEKKWAYGLGVDGVGPGEITYVWTMDYANEPNHFWAYSLRDKVFSLFTLEDSTQKLAQKQIKQSNPEFVLATELLWATDTTFMTLRVSGEGKFVEFTSDGKVLNTYGKWEGMLPSDTPLNITRDIFASEIASNKSRTKFGLMSMERDHFEVMDRETNEILVVEGPFFSKPEFEIAYRSANDPVNYIKDPETAVRAYQDIFLGERFIYLLYSGQRIAKIRQTFESGCQMIFVFDYKGKMISNLELDIPSRFITVDEENQTIYALSSGEDQDIIEYKY